MASLALAQDDRFIFGDVARTAVVSTYQEYMMAIPRYPGLIFGGESPILKSVNEGGVTMDAKKVYFDSQKNDVSADGYLDSSRIADGFIRIGIACGYVDTTEIFFQQENILAKVTAAGQIDFFAGENLLASVSVPAGSGGRGC